MKEVTKSVRLGQLFDLYKELLTVKQRNHFKNYYELDLSLQEIANLEKISRSAVSDSILKTVEFLEETESKLKLFLFLTKLEAIIHEEKSSDQKIKEIEEVLNGF